MRKRLPATASRKPPLLFVHGGYCDAWFWEPYFLPWFAARGYAAYALSLRGHGASGGGETLFIAGLDDYEADVEHVAGTLPSPPVLIGHSMGAAIVELIVAKRPVRGAALLAPVAAGGTAADREPARRVAPQLPDADGRRRSVAPVGRRAAGAAAVLFQRPASRQRSWRRPRAT